MGGDKRRLLIVGGAFSGNFTAREMKSHFHVTVVDAKEFFEYTPGVLRCFVKPQHFDSLSFTLQPVYERKMGVKFIWGEVKELDGIKFKAVIKPMFASESEVIGFDYCMICAGCNFGPFHKWGESLWFPTIHEAARPEGSWPHIDERFIEGRRRHILEEYQKIQGMAAKKSKLLVVGAGFIGVEWVTELQYYFPDLQLTIIDFLPRCLGPLPDLAAEYCEDYMQDVGIATFYGKKYAPNDPKFMEEIGLPDGPDFTYVCIGVKASNYFMPKETLSDVGPGGGGWIMINTKLQVTDKAGKVWADGKIFAVGDCNFGCVGNHPNWIIPPIPKISYPGEEQALHACKNIEIIDQAKYGKYSMFSCCLPKEPFDTWWPWGAGMFATSLGPHDACFVMAANEKKGSGLLVNWWWPAAIQKEIIETTKTDECKDGLIGILIWHFVHHTPVNLWGRGSLFPIV